MQVAMSTAQSLPPLPLQVPLFAPFCSGNLTFQPPLKPLKLSRPSASEGNSGMFAPFVRRVYMQDLCQCGQSERRSCPHTSRHDNTPVWPVRSHGSHGTGLPHTSLEPSLCQMLSLKPQAVSCILGKRVHLEYPLRERKGPMFQEHFTEAPCRSSAAVRPAWVKRRMCVAQEGALLSPLRSPPSLT